MKKVFFPLLMLCFLGLSSFWLNRDATGDEGIQIIANYQQINTVDQLLNPYKGQVVYIDMWATWCGPCRDEMKHAPELKAHIKGKSVTIMYFSIDDPKVAPRWEKLINAMGLQGQHLIANEALLKDLKQKIGVTDNLYIPRYILVDKQGKIIDSDAKRPSQKKVLYAQIDKALEGK
jgi:thiol-disulfide isomerase/thioredoxin